jgi:hypothetical protein
MLCLQAEPQVQQLVVRATLRAQQASARREHQVAVQPAEQVSAQRALPLSRQVPEQELRVWEARQPQVQQPQVQQAPVQQPAASVPPLLPRPSLLFPPWPSLLPLLRRQLLPGYVCAPSPRHPREWNSSASSFP